MGIPGNQILSSGIRAVSLTIFSEILGSFSFHLIFAGMSLLSKGASITRHPLLDGTNKVCAAKLTFKIFTWKSHFHNQDYLKDRDSFIYQIMKCENKKTYLESLSNLGLFKSLGFDNKRSSLLLSSISKPF